MLIELFFTDKIMAQENVSSDLEFNRVHALELYVQLIWLQALQSVVVELEKVPA